MADTLNTIIGYGTVFILGALVALPMLVGLIFRMALHQMNSGPAYVFAVAAVALISLPVLFPGSNSMIAAGIGGAVLLLWLILAKKTPAEGD